MFENCPLKAEFKIQPAKRLPLHDSFPKELPFPDISFRLKSLPELEKALKEKKDEKVYILIPFDGTYQRKERKINLLFGEDFNITVMPTKKALTGIDLSDGHGFIYGVDKRMKSEYFLQLIHRFHRLKSQKTITFFNDF